MRGALLATVAHSIVRSDAQPMLAARRVGARAVAAGMASYATTNSTRSDGDNDTSYGDGPVRDDSVFEHPPFALRELAQPPRDRDFDDDARSFDDNALAPSSSDDDDDETYTKLRRRFPAAPRAELKRFAAARPDGDAVKFYGTYAKWRTSEGSTEALKARAAPLRVGGAASQDRFIAFGARLARDDGLGRKGDRVVLVEGARYDPSDISSSSYAAHVCRTLDAALDADDASQFVVLIDCRAGKGWPNHGAHYFWPLIRELARTVPDNYPERLRRVVVYPLPRWARVSLKTATYLLPAKTRHKVWAVAGDDSRRAPVPEEIRAKAPAVLEGVPSHAAGRHSTEACDGGGDGVLMRRKT